MGSEEGSCQPFLNAIRPFALRWRRLVLHGRAKPYLDQFLSLLSTEVPILEELVVSFETPAPAMNSDSDDNRWSRCEIIRAPRLKRVVIANLNESIAVLQLHWSQMTHLSFEHNKPGRDMSLSANETIEILRQCPNLVSIQVEIGNIESPGVDMDQIAPAPVHSREVVVMHHLLHLTIHTALDLSEFFPVKRPFYENSHSLVYHYPLSASQVLYHFSHGFQLSSDSPLTLAALLWNSFHSASPHVL